jgi:tetratricopeptide (TPR) repeat protein
MVAAVSGTAGVGKTALVVHWAHRVAARFPDGQLYANLRGFDPSGQVMTSAEAIRGFLDALGVPPERIPPGQDAQAALYRSLLAGKRVLVLVDNARDTDQVRPLLPGTPTAVAVVTSRDQLTPLVAAHGARRLALDLLTHDEARELLAQRLGTGRVAAEPQPVEQIITACARLPLALAIAAARAQQTSFPLAALAAELGEAGAWLDALDAGDLTSQVRAVFSWSYTALTPPAARLFRLLGLHAGPDISTSAAASLAARSVPQSRPVLSELTRANLLTEHIPGRYMFHDLLRAYATDLAHTHDPDHTRHAAVTRLLDHYLHTATTADRLLHPARDPSPLPPASPAPGTSPEHLTDSEQAMGWLSSAHPVLLATLHHAAGAGFDTHTWQLAWALDTFLYRQGHWHDRATVWRAALPAALRLGHLPAQAFAHRLLGHADTRLGRHSDAHPRLEQALDLYIRAGDRVGQAHTHYNIAYLWERQGHLDKALDHAQHALTLFQAAGHRRGQAVALSTVGWYHALLGDHTQALTCCEKALTLFQQLGYREGEAPTWDSLGYAHHHLGHHSQAVNCYQHAVTLFGDLGDRYRQAVALTRLGDTRHNAGTPTAARTAWTRALTILTDLDHPDAQSVQAKLHNLDRRATPPPRPRLTPSS